MSVETPATNRATSLIQLLDNLWRGLTTPGLAIILLVWIAALLALSTVIPQLPQDIDDPLARSQWLASVPSGTWPLVERLQSLGIFNLLGSAWMRLPMALLLAHVVASIGNWIPLAWTRGFRPITDQATAWNQIPRRGQRVWIVAEQPRGTDASGELVQHRLQAVGYEVCIQQDRNVFLAWKRRRNWIAVAGVYLGLGMVILGLMLESWLGAVTQITLEPGKAVTLPGTSNTSLVLEEIQVPQASGVTPSGSIVEVTQVTGNGESRLLESSLHTSRWMEGMWLTFLDLRPVAEITARDNAAGEYVLLQPFVPGVPARERIRLPLEGEDDARFTGVPSRNVTLRVDYLPGADQVADLSVSFFRGVETDPSQSVALASGQATQFDGVEYQVTLDRDLLVTVRADCWWLLAGLGLVILIICLILWMVFPPVLVQGQITGEQVRLAVESLFGAKMIARNVQLLLSTNEIHPSWLVTE